MLTQASRSHSVSLLTLDGMKQEDSFFVVYYSGLLKQCRKGKVNPFVMLKKYNLDNAICVYTTLEEYIIDKWKSIFHVQGHYVEKI